MDLRGNPCELKAFEYELVPNTMGLGGNPGGEVGGGEDVLLDGGEEGADVMAFEEEAADGLALEEGADGLAVAGVDANDEDLEDLGVEGGELLGEDEQSD